MAKESNALTERLREMAVKLASGEYGNGVAVTYMLILELCDQDFDRAGKITAGYIRTIMNRVPEIKAKGAVSVKSEDHEQHGKYFAVTLNTDPKRRVLTSEDVEHIERKACNKFAKRLLGFMPNVMHLEGDKRDGAIEGIALYQDMIKKMAEGE
ncbi:hypothetical protein [Enterobacter phage N5822]|nr:hypothetical protein [Enterobacter phage N5822]QPD96227.1 hypothetical protein [Enterobacter phage N5822]